MTNFTLHPTTAVTDTEHRAMLRPAFILLVYIAVFIVGVPALLFGIGLRMDALVPSGFNAGPTSAWAGVMLAFAGTLLVASSMWRLWKRGRGLPVSHLPPTRFVADGPYRFVRHPIYVGFTAFFVGAGIVMGSFWSVTLGTLLLVAGWIAYARFYEEPVLIRRFGADYLLYVGEVGLFGPRRLIGKLAGIGEATKSVLSGMLSVLAARTVLFRAGPAIFVTYGGLVAAGCLLMMFHLAAILVAQGVSTSFVGWYLLAAAAAAMTAAKVFWWIGSWRAVVHEPLYGLRRVGFVSWGALAGLVGVSYFFWKLSAAPFLVLTDALMTSCFIAYALGRIGCLTYGCCYGLPCKRHGVVFVNPESKVIREGADLGTRRIPTQALSALHGAAVFLTLNALLLLQPPAGVITGIAFLLYAVGRGGIEFMRDRRRYGIFTSGHLACVLMFLFGCALLFGLPSGAGPAVVPPGRASFAQVLSVLPVIMMTAVAIFVVMGLHWRRIGTW